MARFQPPHGVNTQNFDKFAIIHHGDPLTQVTHDAQIM
jgi:hypothetical protein